MAEPALASSSEAVRDRAEDAAPSPPPPPTTPFGDLAARMAQTERDYFTTRGRQRQTLEESATAQAPLIAGAEQATQARAALPAPPKPPALPKVPPRGLNMFLAPVDGEAPEQTVAKTIQGVGLLAMAFGSGAKSAGRGALAGLSGAMQGWHAGDKERGDRAFKEWKAQTDTMLAQWDMERTSYADIVKAADLALDDKLRLLKLAQLKYGNKALPDAFDAATLEKTATWIEKQQTAAAKMQSETAKLWSQHWEKEADRAMRWDVAISNQQSHERVARIFAEGRNAIRQEVPAPGEWFDRQTGERAYPTRADYLQPDFKDTYHKSNTLGVTRYEQISIALPMIKRMRQLVPKLLATQPVENLVRAADLAVQGKTSSNPDLREFEALVKDTNVKMTSVMGPGQFRVTLLKVLESAGLKTTDTQATAARLLDQWETNIDNDLRAITGQKLREHIGGPWQGWALSPQGERKWIRVPAGERIEPGWITVEETK